MVNQAVKMKTMEDNPHIAIVSINRPENYNSITVEVLEELIAAAEKIAEDTSIRAVVLTGEGGYFSSGADFSLFASAMGERDTNQARIIGRKGSRACQAWEDLPQPTIAAIEGGVVGGGLAVAMACDWRVMADNSYAYVPEVKVGVNFGWGSLPRLTNLVGGPKAKLMSILCHKHKADECADWGLADYVTDDCGAVDKALEICFYALRMKRQQNTEWKPFRKYRINGSNYWEITLKHYCLVIFLIRKWLNIRIEPCFNPAAGSPAIKNFQMRWINVRK